ncbi:hypothetical protein LTS18_009225 [Coniosporium uncinatum]|uniref:Uncharacterized protein n=1 Tax=Coniosporium uncinatum TaxID=93489 RepID=A0ACC3DAJ9_9PEZI|nr:hypothetical protein LTS18_009225 [Coniosporium uncinatum]
MKVPLLFAVSIVAGPGLAHLQDFAFPGYGFSWYDPVCGYACSNAIASAPLACTSMEAMGHSHGSGPTSPECFASDTAYLTTLAYCMSTRCDSIKVPTWQREKFWSTKVTGDATVLPKWDYTRAVEEVGERPTVEFNSSLENVLSQTMLVSDADYEMQSRFMVLFDYLEALQPKYSFVLITIGFATPIFFALLARLPFMTSVLDKIKPYLVYPSIIGRYHVRPLPWLLGNSPTVGQALYIAMFFLLNLVLSCVNYDRSQPHPWGFGPKEEMLSYIGYRTGHIGYALLPLLMLFSGRNNFLLWMTNWSYSTYILLHRWVARIFAIQAIVHSITLLYTYKGSGSYATDSTQPYWLWGIVATVLTCAMLVLSHIYFRRLAYEAFLLLHIVLAILVIVGCWYHVILRWGYNFYDNWLIAACAVWFFDRLLRVLRVAKNGIQHAVVTEIGPDHVRIDLPGVRWASRPGYVAYAYFPMLHMLRPWENHPFSVNSTTLFRSYKHALLPASASLGQSSSDDVHDVEKTTGKASEAIIVRDAAGEVGTAGVTLIVKKSTGLTKLLKSHGRLLTLLEGPYLHNPSDEVMSCDHVLLIGGGIGITALLPWIHAHPNVKLAWSVKPSAEALIQELDVVLRDMADKEVLIGERLNIEALLRNEVDVGYKKVGVVVCGPAGMCDDVRAIVAGFGRSGKIVFELEVEAFSW